MFAPPQIFGSLCPLHFIVAECLQRSWVLCLTFDCSNWEHFLIGFVFKRALWNVFRQLAVTVGLEQKSTFLILLDFSVLIFLVTPSLGKPSCKKCSFFKYCSKSLWPPPPSFEHYVVNFSEGILTKVRRRLPRQLSTK